MIITYGLIHVINLAWNVKDLYGKNAIIVVCNKKDGTAKNVFIVKMEDVRYIKECIKMKIWEAELNLFDEDFGRGETYKIIFSFESYGEDYELNESQTKYLNVYGMFYDTVPVNMTYENTVWGLKVTQGFTEDKTEEEQEKIKQDMINYMRECLIKEKNRIVESYDNKIDALE